MKIQKTSPRLATAIKSFTVGCAIAPFLAVSTHAQTTTYDGLDYTDGVTLQGESGGFGWDNSWSTNGSAYATIVSPGLTYSQNGTLDTVGNAVELDGDQKRNDGEGSTASAFRQPTNDYASDSYWASSLVQLSSTSSVNGLSFKIGGDNVHFRMDPQTGGGYNAALRSNIGTNVEDFVVGLPEDEALFLVLQLDRTGPDDVINAWVNPDVGGTSPANALGSASITLTSAASAIDNLIFESQGTHTVDEARIGDSFESVSVIPEPGSYALLAGLAALGALALQRRKRA